MAVNHIHGMQAYAAPHRSMKAAVSTPQVQTHPAAQAGSAGAASVRQDGKQAKHPVPSPQEAAGRVGVSRERLYQKNIGQNAGQGVSPEISSKISSKISSEISSERESPKQKIRDQENLKRDHATVASVSISEDGDVVAVSREGIQAAVQDTALHRSSGSFNGFVEGTSSGSLTKTSSDVSAKPAPEVPEQKLGEGSIQRQEPERNKAQNIAKNITQSIVQNTERRQNVQQEINKKIEQDKQQKLDLEEQNKIQNEKQSKRREEIREEIRKEIREEIQENEVLSKEAKKETPQETIKEPAEKPVPEAADTEKAEPEVTSLVGYTEAQVERLYRDGRISAYDYQQYEEEREARLSEMREAAATVSQDVAAVVSVTNQTENDRIAIDSMTADTEEFVDAMQRVGGRGSEAQKQPSGMAEGAKAVFTPTNDSIQERQTEEKGRLWDYQLLA